MADATRGLLASLDAAPSKAERRAIVDKVCDYAEQEGLMDAEMLDVVSAMGGISTRPQANQTMLTRDRRRHGGEAADQVPRSARQGAGRCGGEASWSDQQ